MSDPDPEVLRQRDEDGKFHVRGSGAAGERADFEAWARDLPFPLSLSFGWRSEDVTDTYFEYPTRLAWAAWKARAAIAARALLAKEVGRGA